MVMGKFFWEDPERGRLVRGILKSAALRADGELRWSFDGLTIDCS